MADRYWVGGTNTWNSVAGTKWATTSSGAGGASAPTSADNVFINAASGIGTITVDVGQNANVVDFTGFTGTLNLGNYANLETRGLTLSSSMTISGATGIIVRTNTSSTSSLNTNGKIIPNGLTIFPGASGTVQLASAVVVNGQLDTGSSQVGELFSLNGFNIDCVSLNIGSGAGIAFGTNRINITGNNQTVLNQAYTATVSYSGSGGIYATYTGSVGTRSFSGGTSGTIFTDGSAPLYITGGTDRIDFSSSIFSFGVNFTGFSGTLGLASASGTKTIGCNWNPCVFVNTFVIEPTSTVVYSLTGIISGTVQQSQYWRLGVAFSTVTLASNFTNIYDGTYTAIASNANITLSGFVLTVDNLVMAGSGLRLIGPGTVNITGNNKTVLRTYSSPQLQNSVVINLTYSGSVGTRTIIDTYLDLYNTLPTGTPLNITGGSDIIDFGTTLESYVQDLNLTGFSGTMTGNVSVSGTLTLASTNNFAPVSTITYRSSSNSTSGTYGLATVGGACKCPTNLLLAWTIGSFVISGASTVRLLNDVTLTDNAAFNASFTIRAGILDLNGFNLSVPQFTFSFSTNSYKRIIFSTGNKIIINSRGIAGSVTYSSFTSYMNFVSTDGANLFEISGSSGRQRSISLTTSSYGFAGATDSQAVRLSIVNTSDAITISNGKFNGLTTDNTFSGSILFSGTPYFTGPIVFGSTGTIEGWSAGSPTIYAMSGCTLSSGITLQCGIIVENYNSSQIASLVLFSNITIQVLNPSHIDFVLSNAQNSGSPASVDLSSFTLNVGAINFGGSGTAGTTFNFNTGTLNITGNGKTVLNTSGTRPTYSGTTRQFNLTYSGSVGTRTVTHNVSTYGAPDLRVTGGSDTITNSSGANGYGNVDFTGFTGNLTGNLITAYGNFTLNAGMNVTQWLKMRANTGLTSTFTRNGASLQANVYFDGPGTCQLSDSLVTTSVVSIDSTAGHTFNSNSNVITCSAFQSTSSVSRTINLGTSNITINAVIANLTVVNLNSSGLTFNGNSALITVNLPTTTTQLLIFNGGGQTFNNVVISSVSNLLYGLTFSGTNTFNNLTFAATTSTGLTIIIGADQTVNGTFIINGLDNNLRQFVRSNIIGTARTLTCAAATAVTDVDFRDITIASTAPLSGTRLGDCGRNTNITFDAGVNKYWNLAAGGDWNATAWATSSGGAVANTNFPLPQDTVIIENTGLNTGATITINAGFNIGTFDMSTRSNAMTLSITGSPTFYENLIYNSLITPSGTGTIIFSNSSIKTFDCAGKTFDTSITIDGAISGGVQLINNSFVTGSTRLTTLTQGTLDLNDLDWTTGGFNSFISNTRTIDFGTGKINCSGAAAFTLGAVWNIRPGTNLTVSGTPVVNITSTGATGIYVYPGTLSEANSISFNFTGGTYSLTFLYSFTARNVNFTGYAGTAGTLNGTIYGNLTLSSGMSLTSTTTTLYFNTTGTKTITSNGKIITFPISFDGVGGAWQLQDAMTLTSGRPVTFTNGTVDLNGFTLTAGSGSGTAVGTQNITFNGGTLLLNGSGATAWNNAQPTNFTTTAGTGTGTISMTAATAKTFVGGGSIYNCNLNQGGAGALTITGSNTFSNITNTYKSTGATSILFTAGTITTFVNWNASGESTRLLTIGSVTAASHTLFKASGTVSADYLSISRSTATGGAIWNAGANSTDGGNNLGWFGSIPVTGNSNMFMMFI